jgi:hypothetical protein
VERAGGGVSDVSGGRRDSVVAGDAGRGMTIPFKS